MDDAQLAAEHFNWLVPAIPLNFVMFHAAGVRFTPADLDRWADEAACAIA